MPARVDQQVTGRKLGDSEAVSKRCAELEHRLAELNALFEQYFMGVERRPPTRKHETYRSELTDLKATVVRQTAVKFRVGNLWQRYLTHERLWDRTLKEIEAGTYRRDVLRAKKHLQQKVAAPVEELPPEELDVSDLDVEEEALPPPAPVLPPIQPVVSAPKPPGLKPVATTKAGVPLVAPLVAPKPVAPVAAPPVAAKGPPMVTAAPAMAVPLMKAAPKPAAAPPADPGLSEQKIRAIYDAYVTAKRRCGEDTSSLSLSSVADSLRKQVPVLMKQHKAKSVDFKVVIKDGKAVLRALPKDD